MYTKYVLFMYQEGLAINWVILQNMPPSLLLQLKPTQDTNQCAGSAFVSGSKETSEKNEDPDQSFKKNVDPTNLEKKIWIQPDPQHRYLHINHSPSCVMKPSTPSAAPQSWLRAVMWIRIRSEPHSFGSVDPEVKNEGKSRV